MTNMSEVHNDDSSSVAIKARTWHMPFSHEQKFCRNLRFFSRISSDTLRKIMVWHSWTTSTELVWTIFINVLVKMKVQWTFFAHTNRTCVQTIHEDRQAFHRNQLYNHFFGSWTANFPENSIKWSVKRFFCYYPKKFWIFSMRPEKRQDTCRC